jgi:hypothetical protein
MTTKLSERLRELLFSLDAQLKPSQAAFHNLRKAIAQAEAQEAQTGELSDYRSPMSSEARGRAISALESIGKDAREVFDHGTSLLTVRAGSARIIAVSDRALSALRK